VRGGFVKDGLRDGHCSVYACLGWLWRLKSFAAMFERCQHYRPRRWMVHTTLDTHTEHENFGATRIKHASIYVPKRLRQTQQAPSTYHLPPILAMKATLETETPLTPSMPHNAMQ
jgi:hypothetical protein